MRGTGQECLCIIVIFSLPVSTAVRTGHDGRMKRSGLIEGGGGRVRYRKMMAGA